MSLFAPFQNNQFLPPKQTVVPLPGKIEIMRQLPPPEIIWLDEVDSTHNLLKSPDYADFPPFKLLAARRQTAGRGQRGNSWEAEPFKNLSFSMAVMPSFLHPSQQFSLSEATALAVVALLQNEGIDALVKWPNDIYVGDKKICGILIDHAIDANSILRSVVSAGINVNQLEFKSDAPNPISMIQLLNRETDLNHLARNFILLFREFYNLLQSASGRDTIHASFMRHLYRFDGRPHPFIDNIRKMSFSGIIRDIGRDGTLVVEDTASPSTPPLNFLFKEITFII